MKFKELSIEDLKKEINNFLKTKTADEIIDTLEQYSASDKLQSLYNKISYLENEKNNVEYEETIYVEIDDCGLKYNKNIEYNSQNLYNSNEFNEWECDAA